MAIAKFYKVLGYFVSTFVQLYYLSVSTVMLFIVKTLLLEHWMTELNSSIKDTRTLIA